MDDTPMPLGSRIRAWLNGVRCLGMVLVLCGFGAIGVFPVVNPEPVAAFTGPPPASVPPWATVVPVDPSPGVPSDSGAGIAMYGGGFLIVAVGATLLFTGRIFWDRSGRAEPICRRCGFEMWRSDSAVCPECGPAET